MYVPAAFALTDPATITAIVRECAMGTLVTVTPDGLDATPVPWLVQGSESGIQGLAGHVSRANSIWRNARTDSEVLVVFSLADAYVSPSAYASKAEHGKVVPTWNYVAVHVHGRLVVHDDVEWLRAQVAALTDTHEAQQTTPWQVGDAPEDFINATLRGIVGLEVVATKVEAKAKLSQNKSDRDLARVQHLHEHGEADARRLAAMMRESLT